MIIDTKDEASTLWRTKIFAVIVFSLLILATIFFNYLSKTQRMLICGGWSVVLLLLYGFQYKMEYTYFYFSNNNKNLIFRFYSFRNLYGKPKTIEIPKSSFYKYDLASSFFNMKESLVLYQKTPKGIAKYPPISLTLLPKKKKTELKRALYAASAG